MTSLKVSIILSLFALLICTSIQHVTVFSTVSYYVWVWTWSAKSIDNVYQLYYLPFLCNWLLSFALLLSLLTVIAPICQRLIASITRYFYYMLAMLLVAVAFANAGFFVFDLEVYPSSTVAPAQSHLAHNASALCDYWTVMDDRYLQSDLCGRSD